MGHWTDKYIGIKVVDGEFDCAHLAELVCLQEFHRIITLPKERDYVGLEPIAKFHAMSSQIQRHRATSAEQTQNPEDGDGVLLITRGYKQHIGIYAHIQHEGWVLHACDMRVGPQVVLQRIRNLDVRGIKVEGYYKWK